MSPRRTSAALGVLALVAAALAWAVEPAGRLLGVAEAVVGSLLLISCSTLALNGSRPAPLPTRRAVRTVLASTAANALTPAGVGGTVLTVRVHRRTGLSCEQAVAAAGLRTAAGALVAVLVTVATAGAVGTGSLPAFSPPDAIAIALLVTAATAVLLSAVPVARRVLSSLRRTAVDAGAVLRRPRCCVALLLGCLGVTAGQLMTLAGAVRAVGGHLELTGLLVALLGSTAARSAFPSPGGVGPIEAALVAGLTTLGMHLGAATLAVVVYRTAGHWLPVLAGATSIRHLRRHALL